MKKYSKPCIILALLFGTTLGVSYKINDSNQTKLQKQDISIASKQNEKEISTDAPKTEVNSPADTVKESIASAQTQEVKSTATVQPTKTQAATTQSTAPSEVKAMNEMTIYEYSHIDETKVIKNSPKFAVKLDRNSGIKAGDNVKLTVLNLEKLKGCVGHYEKYLEGFISGNNGMWLSDGSYQDTIVIQNHNMVDNAIPLYIFIKPSGEDTYYEYYFTLTK